MHEMMPHLREINFPPLKRTGVDTLQVNLGYTCNQSCLHCHVNAGPNRKEQMDDDTLDLVLQVAKALKIQSLDLTGGAPELNPGFRRLVRDTHELRIKIIDRCNLTILSEPGQEDLAEFLADHHVEITASLPCYLEENVDKQRGKGVFQRSIQGLKRLNTLGYGQASQDLVLNLVYNPLGPYLPPPQLALEADYRKMLSERFEVSFNNLYTITNMPIARFGSTLISRGELDSYLTLLQDAFSPGNLESVMCRNLVSVDHRGYLYDCDFNQMLGQGIRRDRNHLHLSNLLEQDLNQHPIFVAGHCYGCTAGQGSSCGGAL